MKTNERPTPLTDEIEACYFNSSSHADVRALELFPKVRNLERSLAERTEERDALKKAISEGTRLDYVVRSYEAMASDLIAERDNALAKLAAFSSGYVDSKQHNAMAKKLAESEAHAKRLQDKLAEVQAERDALKAKLATINHIAMSLFVRSTSSEVTGEMAEIGRLLREDGK